MAVFGPMPSKYHGGFRADGALYFHHRRCGFLARQGPRLGGPRGALAGPWLLGAPAQARPLSQRRSRHHVALRAWRGLRHQRRRRDRSRPRPLRALHGRCRPQDRLGLLGARLFERAGEGAPRRLPRQDHPGHPACHQRDQGLDRHRRRGGRFHALRDRRHRGRHRGPALLRGDPPVQPGPPARPMHLHAPDAAALSGRLRRAQDQADPALRQGAALHRPSARCAGLPLGGHDPREGARQDRPFLQRAPRIRNPRL